MADEQKAKRLEIGHVLFMDIVGYSKLLTDEQSEALQELNQIVRSTEVAREAEAAGRLTILPTGDGMALVFAGSVEEPVECALEISQALRAQPSLPVRMGIHSGPVHHVKDANGRENIAGVGINIAQRVMDCGDAGHILVSKRVADDLAQQRRWQPYLHELGDVEVKHGVVVSLVNLYAETIGNPTLPTRLGNVRGSVRALPKGPRKGLSPIMRAIFIVLGLSIALVFVLAIVAVIFAPAIIRTLDQHQSAIRPQSNATAAPSLGDTIRSAVTKQITDELQSELARKKKGAVEPTLIGSEVPEKSIAVLPFENLSEDKGAAYFAEGIQDEILTKLASIADLKVISRTSTAKYKSTPEDLRTVSKQLGAANILEGSVQKAGDKVRVNVQLIDARADSHLWAKTYDRDMKDVFAIQTEVAQEIADSLKAKLSPAEANTVARAPTKDMQAYDLFLKGEFEQRVANSNFRSESFDQAARWYKEAIARDPNFALAIAQLAICQLRRHWLIDPLPKAEVMEAGRLAKQAATLAPDLAEAHIAVGLFHYYGFREYEPALTEFQRALQLQPNNALALSFVAFVHRRQGKWDLALDELKKSIELDPRNSYTMAGLAETYVFLRMWKKAEDLARRGLTIDPHEATCMRMLLLSSLNQTGSAQEPLRLLATFPPDDLLLPNTGMFDMVVGTRGEIFVLARDFEAAIRACETGTIKAGNEWQRFAAKAGIRVMAGDVSGVQSDAEKARDLLEARLRQQPNDFRSLRALSWVYLALNRKSDAINVARQTVDLLPLEKDAVLGSGNLAALAGIQAQTGAVTEAVQNLRKLLSVPAGETISIVRLKIDPVWDPIRDRPDFQQLLSGSELIGPNK
ncbi:MAG: adenylate/guanylate cyclase domain-containing protein [Alphaproteobacteria bacterium]